MDLDVVFLGTAGSVPTAGRALPATLVRRGGERLLFDCGEGTQRQLLRSIGLVDLEEIFLTHFHADHVLGLPGLLKTFSLRGRDAPLTIYGPPGLQSLFAAMRVVIGQTAYELRLVELEAGAELVRDGYRLAAFEVRHRVRAHGYALIEDERPGRLDDARATELGVTPGPDFGRLQRGETVAGSHGEVQPEAVLGPPRAGRKVVLSGDSSPSELTAAVAYRADLLIHEATFTRAEAERARETGHSTAFAAAELAANAGVKLLALNHLSPRHPAGEIRAEAREAFDRTVVPRDFDRIEIPFPERGTPFLERADEQRPLETPSA
jgi:ribonuclease Z